MGHHVLRTHELSNLIGARHGHFRLESGEHGSVWLDLDGLFLRPGRLHGYGEELAGRLAVYGPDVICGPLVGGAFLAQMIAIMLGLEFAFAERVVRGVAVKYRIPPVLAAAVRGKAVAIVDDAINAGSAVRGTLSSLEACGARVVAVGALVVLGTMGRDHVARRKIPLEGVVEMANELWTPDACPLCAAGIPLDQTG